MHDPAEMDGIAVTRRPGTMCVSVCCPAPFFADVSCSNVWWRTVIGAVFVRQI